MKKYKLLLALALCGVLAGCGRPVPPQEGQPTPSLETSIVLLTPFTEEMGTPASPEEEQSATLYIGTKAHGFREYPMTYEGELTPETLIQGISDLTGWNLTLAEPVISGKGGISVCLSDESTLFAGPPDPQTEEFFVFGLDDLAETLLDSVQKTLQEGFTLESGDPDSLDIWYFLEGEQPLSLPDLELSWPIDQPYQWAGAERGG